MNSYENTPPLPIIALIISFWKFALCIFAVFLPSSMRLKQHSWNKDAGEGWMEAKEGEGRAGHLISSIFQLILLKASRRHG